MEEISKVDVFASTITVKGYFSLTWQDRRLNFSALPNDSSYFALGVESVKRLWIPNVEFMRLDEVIQCFAVYTV